MVCNVNKETADDWDFFVQERRISYVNHNQEDLHEAEYSDIDPRHMLSKNEDWSDKEKKKFKKNKEKKKSGALKLKKMRLKNAGKTAYEKQVFSSK